MKQSDFKSESELKAMKVAEIKKHVREFNDHLAIRGYSKATKDQLIGQVLTAQDRVRNSGKSAPKPTVSFKSPPKKGEESKPRPVKKAPTPKKAPASPVKSTSPVKSASPSSDKAVDYIMKEFATKNGSISDDMRIVMELSPELYSLKNGRGRYTSKGEDVGQNILFMTDKQKAEMRKGVEKILEDIKKQGLVKSGSAFEKWLKSPSLMTLEDVLKSNGLPFAYSMGDIFAEDPSKRSAFLAKSPTALSVMVKKLATLIKGIESDKTFDLATAKKQLGFGTIIRAISLGQGQKAREFRDKLLKGKKGTQKQLEVVKKKIDTAREKGLKQFEKINKNLRTDDDGWRKVWEDFEEDFKF